MDIRKPNDFELKKVLSLSPQAIFDGTLGEVEPTKEKIDQLVKPLLEKGSYYLIATKKDKLMGWILIGASKDQFTDVMNGFIYELFVIEEFRGNGISQMLMRAVSEPCSGCIYFRPGTGEKTAPHYCQLITHEALLKECPEHTPF